MKAADHNRGKALVVVCVVVPIASVHFFTGSAYDAPCPEFVNGYLLDILVTLAFYLLLSLPEIPVLRPRPASPPRVFGAAAFVEIAQFCGFPIFGRTYDPLDFAMYGLGAALAALLDTVLFPRLFECRTPRPRA